MPTREELIQMVEAKRRREDLIRQVEEKRAREAAAASGKLSGPVDEALFFARSAAEGHTAGVSEPLIARFKGMLASQADELRAPPGMFSDLELSMAEKSDRAYQDAIRRDVEQRRAEKAANPELDIAGQFVGGVTPSPVNVGARLVKAGNAAAKTLKVGDASKSALAARAKQGAFSGGVAGVGYEGVRQASERPDGFIEGSDPVTDTAITGGLSAGFGASTPYIGAASRAAGRALGRHTSDAGKSAVSTLFGVSRQNIDRYLANPDRINKAKSISEIKDSIDQVVTRIRDDFDQAKIDQAEAKEALRALKQQVTQGLSDKKIEVKDAARKAEEILEDAWKRTLDPLKSKPAPTALAPKAVEMVEELQKGVNQGSEEAMMLLRNTEDLVPVAPLKAKVSKAIKNYQVEGAGPITDTGTSAVASLERLQQRLDKLPKKLALEEAKAIIKQLDQDINWKDAAGQFMDPASRDKLALRRYLDEVVKELSPDYREAMKPVAEKASLLSEASPAFGDERKAVSRLASINTPKGKLDLDLLSRLEQQTGRAGEITKPAQDYVRVQKLLRDARALEEMKRSLPEYQAYRSAAADLARRNPKWTREQVDRAMQSSKEARALGQAETKLEKAKGLLDRVRGITPDTSEGKIRAAMRGDERNIEVRKRLGKLGDMAGQDYMQQIDDLAVKESFEKPYYHGSRNTFLWTLGGLIAGGLPGAGGGAAIGQFIDRYGPRLGKKVLDAVIEAKRMGGDFTANIQKLPLPEAVKQDLITQARLHAIVGGKGRAYPGRVAAEQEKEERVPDQKRIMSEEEARQQYLEN